MYSLGCSTTLLLSALASNSLRETSRGASHLRHCDPLQQSLALTLSDRDGKLIEVQMGCWPADQHVFNCIFEGLLYDLQEADVQHALGVLMDSAFDLQGPRITTQVVVSVPMLRLHLQVCLHVVGA